MVDNDEKEHKECKWSEDEDDYFWESSYDFTWQFTDDGPKENDMNYCPRCGGRLIVKIHTIALPQSPRN